MSLDPIAPELVSVDPNIKLIEPGSAEATMSLPGATRWVFEVVGKRHVIYDPAVVEIGNTHAKYVSLCGR